MPKLAAVLLLLAGCASSGGDLITERTLPCGQGQAIDIMAYMAVPQAGRELGGRMNLVFTVNVFNTTGNDIDVDLITVEPISASGMTMERGYREFDVTIPEGEEKDFEIPLMATMLENNRRAGVDLRDNEAMSMAVKIKLGNGDTYLCRYSLGSR
ncbi:MAG TPA: hypothetical protein VGF48_23700 [Thermoanaerobaculia bacterium]|jgi:hypothetical protein